MSEQKKYPRSYAASRIARNKAQNKSSGQCAKYVRIALETAGYRLPGGGGLNSLGRTNAKEYHNLGILKKIGFQEISLNSKYQTGDVMVFTSAYGHNYGHIQMFDGEIWVSDFKQKGDTIWTGVSRENALKYAHLYRDNSTNLFTVEEMAKLSEGINEGYSNDSPSSTTPLESEPTGLKYFHFDHDFIERGIRLYKEYYNKQDIEDNKEGRGSGDIGFVPLSLSITFDGISGWVIYDKLRINQKLLPPQYPENFNFVITGISHTISGHDWQTVIETISVPDLEPKRWNKTAVLSTVPQIATVNSFNGGISNNQMTPDQNKYMKMVYDSLITAGLNKNQARILTAEIGRENSSNPNMLFGGHKDPYKGSNMGMISWQGSRRTKLLSHLQKQGLINSDGRLAATQQCLNAQARFIIWEINNDKSYLKTKNQFLNNPNVSYEEGARVLGTNYILWIS